MTPSSRNEPASRVLIRIEYSLVLLRKLRVTAITDANLLRDTVMRESHVFGGALLIEDLTAVSTVVLPISEAEGSATP